MDPIRFDALTRVLFQDRGRRPLVALLLALPFVGLQTDLPVHEAAAERPRDRLQRRKAQRRRKQRKRKQQNPRNNGKNNNNSNGNSNNGGGRGSRPGLVGCQQNGGPCQQDNDCCEGNCFAQICTNPPDQCGGTNCPASATGCCANDGCCTSPTNQCNPSGLCCAPNCVGKQCGSDGCGNSGACGSCAQGQTCNLATAQCEGPVCSGQSCPHGCCDANEVCQPGNTVQQCGGGGIACFSCGPNQYCSAETGTCRDNPPCSRVTCPSGCCEPQENGPDICRTGRRGCGDGAVCCDGCCDGNGTCQPGTDGSACGINGSTCIQCDPLNNLCDQGRCQCDAHNCPNGCCDHGPGQPGICLLTCGTGGVQCKSTNGEECTEDSDCCSANCFGGVCAVTVTECGGVTCARVSKGCCGTTCCDDATTCCGTGASCQDNQCICDAQQCDGCCENGPGSPGRCLENAPPRCGIGGAPCQSCPEGCCDVGGSCQAGTTIENCATASGICQTCNDRLEVCDGEQCVLCEHDCTCQGQSACDGTTLAPNTSCGTSRTGHPCVCMVRTNLQPVCIVAPFLVPCTATCVGDEECQACYGPLAMCVVGGPRCDLIPGTSTNFCALPCET